MKKNLILLILIFSFAAYSQNLQWANNITNGDNFGKQIIVDNKQNVYTVGVFTGVADFDPQIISTYTLASNTGFYDTYISKLDSLGNFVWSKNIGGNGNTRGQYIASDSKGNVYISGYFSGTIDFDSGSGSYTVTSIGGNNGFISKYNKFGDFIWAKTYGNTGVNLGGALVIDKFDFVYMTGIFSGTCTFNTSLGTLSLTSSGSTDILVSKLDTNGNYIFAKTLGGPNSDYGNDIAVDKFGNIYTTGEYLTSSDFDPGAGVYNITGNGQYDVFVSKLDSLGNFLWAKSIGGTGADYGTCLACDSLGNVYTCGKYQGTVDFDPGVGIFILTTSSDFILKLDKNGSFKWAKKTTNSRISDISIDKNANIYITGVFSNTADFDLGPSSYNISSLGFNDMYILNIDSLSNFQNVLIMGGSDNSTPSSLFIDDSESIYITGSQMETSSGTGGSCDFDPSSNVYYLTPPGYLNTFISKFGNTTITGVENYNKLRALNLFPNPNNGTFNIVSKNKMNLSLINNLGQIIETIELNEENGYQQTIQIHTSGIYYLNCVTEQSSIKHKIIVTH